MCSAGHLNGIWVRGMLQRGMAGCGTSVQYWCFLRYFFLIHNGLLTLGVLLVTSVSAASQRAYFLINETVSKVSR